MKLERQRRRRNRTTGEMTDLKTMKTPITRFALQMHLERSRVWLNTCDRGTVLKLDGQDLFCSAIPEPDTLGYFDLTSLSPGKKLCLTFPFGQLEGIVRKILHGDWIFWGGEWLDQEDLTCIRVSIEIEGVWKGSKQAFFNCRNDLNRCIAFEPLDGELRTTWEQLEEQELDACGFPTDEEVQAKLGDDIFEWAVKESQERHARRLRRN